MLRGGHQKISEEGRALISVHVSSVLCDNTAVRSSTEVFYNTIASSWLSSTVLSGDMLWTVVFVNTTCHGLCYLDYAADCFHAVLNCPNSSNKRTAFKFIQMPLFLFPCGNIIDVC